MAGDDLDDDYAPDGLVAASDDEGPDDFGALEGEETQFVSEDIPNPVAGRKRPAPEEPSTSAKDEDSKKEKSKKKRQKDNERKAKVCSDASADACSRTNIRCIA